MPDPRADDEQRVRARRRQPRDLIFEKQDLLAPLLAGMLAPPHPMVPGTTEKDYYQGHVTQATAGQTWPTDADRPRDDHRSEGRVTG